MQYSPKLKRILAEIKAILDREDVAGTVVLHTEGFAEFLLKINPSYSIAKIENENIRFKANLQKDFNGNKRLLEHKLTATSNMFRLLSEVNAQLAMNLINGSEMIDEITGTEHGDTSIISQTDLDN